MSILPYLIRFRIASKSFHSHPKRDFLLWPSSCCFFAQPLKGSSSGLPPESHAALSLRNITILRLSFFCGAEVALRFPCTGPGCVSLLVASSEIFSSYRGPHNLLPYVRSLGSYITVLRLSFCRALWRPIQSQLRYETHCN